MRGIFISYRRDDAAGHAGRLFDGLKERFGADRVFMDVTDLRPGQDFVVELERELEKCDYLLAVIGPKWLDAVDATGKRRLDNDDDLVRREVGAALARNAIVIPVLVHGAHMPSAEALPRELKPLARRQAIELTDRRWESDLRELIDCFAADGPAQTNAGLAASARSQAAAHAVGPPRAGGSAHTRGLGPGSIAMFVLGLAVAIVGVWLVLQRATFLPGQDGTKAQQMTADKPAAVQEGRRDPDAGTATNERSASPSRPIDATAAAMPGAPAAVLDGAVAEQERTARLAREREAVSSGRRVAAPGQDTQTTQVTDRPAQDRAASSRCSDLLARQSLGERLSVKDFEYLLGNCR